jgi:hypothetical protein
MKIEHFLKNNKKFLLKYEMFFTAAPGFTAIAARNISDADKYIVDAAKQMKAIRCREWA